MKKFIRRFLLLIFLILLFIMILFSTLIFGKGYLLYRTATSQISVYNKINEIRSEETFLTISEVPQDYVNAVIAVEDHRFRYHSALDLIGISRAIFSNISTKEFREGGSTITQQLAKNMYFIDEKDVVSRKIAEVIVGYELEKSCTKDQIFELYMNTIYFGDGYYGIKNAANGYLNKEPIDMNLYECTMLAGIPNAPSVYSPSVNPDLTRKRQEKVISDMLEYGYLTEAEVETIYNSEE